MSLRSSSLTSAQISKKIKSKHGQGAGSEYQPWLKIQDINSSGRSHRVYSHKTQRTHHLASDLELSLFLMLDWSSSVLDIRERFPFEPDKAQGIAKKAKLSYPIQDGVPQILYSDFLVDAKFGSNEQFAINVRPSSTLAKKENISHLELERRYWFSKGIKLFVATEKEVDAAVLKNIEKLAPYFNNMECMKEALSQVSIFQKQLEKYPNSHVVEICKSIDQAYDLALGESLSLFKTLLATRVINFDIRVPINNLVLKDLIFKTGLEWIGEQHVAN